MIIDAQLGELTACITPRAFRVHAPDFINAAILGGAPLAKAAAPSPSMPMTTTGALVWARQARLVQSARVMILVFMALQRS